MNFNFYSMREIFIKTLMKDMEGLDVAHTY